MHKSILNHKHKWKHLEIMYPKEVQVIATKEAIDHKIEDKVSVDQVGGDDPPNNNTNNIPGLSKTDVN